MKNSKNENSRRQFLQKVGGITVATVGANVVGLPALAALSDSKVEAKELASKSADDDLENALFQQIGQLKLELDLRNGAIS